MEYDFSGVEEMQRLEEVPQGTYLCRVEEVREKETNDSHPCWGLRLAVAEGPYKGRTAAWDNLVWSPRAISRVKKILRLMGFPVAGKVKIEPRELEGKEVRVMIAPQVFTDPVTGARSTRNRVPYDGYLEEGEEEPGTTGDAPF